MKYSDADMKAAHEIVGAPGRGIILGGPHLQLAEEVAKAVAEGIAFGRTQGLELAASAIEKELVSLAGRIRHIPG